jgi:conjugative relaxase-like TrwC/TraI family protein
VVGDPTTPLKARSPATRSQALVHGRVRDPDCSYYPPPGETGRARPDATVGEPGVISIRRISLGGGYRYLMDSVAAGDGAVERSNGVTRYYASSGTPPGVFLGAGLAELDGGRGVEIGSHVTEDHLEAMLAGMADPVTGEPVGTTPRAPRGGVPVAGFDLTFSPSKSVSVAWALADEGTKAVIYECHRRAVAYVLSWAEGEVSHSRSGTNGIVEEDVTGVVAAAFTHWTSRANDPQLHDHVVIWNRAKSVSDGKWRTLDSRSIFKATTTLSELHQGVLSDLLTEALGLSPPGASRATSRWLHVSGPTTGGRWRCWLLPRCVPNDVIWPSRSSGPPTGRVLTRSCSESAARRSPVWSSATPMAAGPPSRLSGGRRAAVLRDEVATRYRQSGACKKRLVHQPGDHFLGDRREVPDIHADVDHASLLAPLLVDVPVEQPHPLVDRPELGVAFDLAAIALVREVADEDLPVADGHRKRPLTNLVEPGVEVLLLQAQGPLPVSVPASVVVPRVQDLVPSELADKRHRLLPPTHCDVTEDVDGVVRADDGVPVRDEHGVHLADAVERPVAVTDDVLVTEVLVCGEVGGHGSVVSWEVLNWSE